jgi:c-di-AMP phosphodiesterase-like protein
MPKFLLKRWHGLHTIWIFTWMIILTLVLFFYEWWIGIAALVICGLLVYYTLLAEKSFRKELNQYIATISHRVRKAGNEVIQELPIGILLYNEEKGIEWHNPFVARMFETESLIGLPLMEKLPELKNVKDKDTTLQLQLKQRVYQVQVKVEERLLYITDITEWSLLKQKYEEEKTVIGIVMLDNLEEATQGMDDQSRSIMLAKVTSEITEWAQKYTLYLRRTSNDRFLLLFNQKSLKALEQSRFEILDEVRDLTIENKVPLTLSIGIAAGVNSLVELGHLAQTSLDIALGRGGDQAAVKVNDRLSFYGGRSSAVEKRTRVRARVISHALRDLIRGSENVVIMGHRFPDMDSVGAAIGVLKAVQLSNKEGYIVLERVNPAIQRLMEHIREDERLNRWFITPEQALQVMHPRTLAVVVDTHKASMVDEPKLVQMSQRKFVVDHHRRGEEFINDATLVYMEPYASSTCELVTELLQYFAERISMEPLEATALLAGIVVDTKSFSYRTGSRTFEAASFLRRSGADSAMIQRMLQEDLDSYLQKSEIIRNTVILYDHIALAVARSNRQYPQLTIAKVADTLLNMTGILASFVICERTDGLIGISARSMGQVNVQVIMERLGGGGHLTNAATQMEGTLQEAERALKRVLEQMKEEEGLLE